MNNNTKRSLITYGLIGLAATPIAILGGEALAALFCIATAIVVGISRKRI